MRKIIIAFFVVFLLPVLSNSKEGIKLLFNGQWGRFECDTYHFTDGTFKDVCTVDEIELVQDDRIIIGSWDVIRDGKKVQQGKITGSVFILVFSGKEEVFDFQNNLTYECIINGTYHPKDVIEERIEGNKFCFQDKSSEPFMIGKYVMLKKE